LEHSFSIPQYFEVPESDHSVATPLDLSRSIFIVTPSGIDRVLRSVELDDESFLFRDEIDDEGSDRVLPSKLHSEETPVPEVSP